jgi:hypothetical protein
MGGGEPDLVAISGRGIFVKYELHRLPLLGRTQWAKRERLAKQMFGCDDKPG